MDEFSLIDEYFKVDDTSSQIGDDCAIISLPENQSLLVSTDTLVSGVHFLPSWPAKVIAHKAFMVNLSDIAAMGGTPSWFLLALTLPQIDKTWLASFSETLLTLARRFNVQLIGGDMTRGPLTITLTVHGLVAAGKAVKRSGASVADKIYVTGSLGAPALAVEYLNATSLNKKVKKALFQKLYYPKACLAYAPFICQFASSCIDISDGLSADLSHVLKQSDKGARIDVSLLPVASIVQQLLPAKKQLAYALHGGDEYELCFTVPEGKCALLEAALKKANLPFYCIGQIEKQKGLRLKNSAGEISTITPKGYRHFD